MSKFRFCTTAAKGAWKVNPRSHDKMVFGGASHLVRDLEQVTESVKATGGPRALGFHPVTDGINALLAEVDDLKRFLSEDRGYPVESGIAVLKGLKFALEGLQAWVDHRTSPGPKLDQCLQDHFSSAITEFDEAWDDARPYPTLSDETWLSQVSGDPFSPIFRELGRKATCAGFWIAWDLVATLAERIGFGKAPVVRGRATTPVVFEQAHDPDRPGVLGWLTVELLDGPGCGFHPDALSIGLTALRTKVSHHTGSNATSDSSGHHHFLDSMRDAWNKSGLADKCRGRWRISPLCPVEDPRFSGLPKFYPRRLDGRSAEAATLAAIWAADQRIPYEPELETSAGLAIDVAVSASLGEVPSEKPRTEIPLLPVLGTREKISAAKPLDTLMFASKEEKSEAERDIQTQQAEPVYRGLWINRVSTIGEALERLLETNRHLAKYQSEMRARWLCQWEGDTGLAADDPKPWTDEDAEAARRSVFQRPTS